MSLLTITSKFHVSFSFLKNENRVYLNSFPEGNWVLLVRNSSITGKLKFKGYTFKSWFLRMYKFKCSPSPPQSPLQTSSLGGEKTHCYRDAYQFSSVQFSSSVVSDSFRPHVSQHARPSCPSPTPGVHSDSRPSSQWCHPAISSSVVPFSPCPQSLPASESFPMSQLFAWGGHANGPKVWGRVTGGAGIGSPSLWKLTPSPLSLPSILPGCLQWSECQILSILLTPGFPGGSDGKESARSVGDSGSIPGLEDPLEKEMATHSRILAWRILWMEEPGGLQSMGSWRVGHDWATSLHFTSSTQASKWSGALLLMGG